MSFSSDIIEWYNKHHRHLPWRETDNPYYIWISEIILQQTRVVQAISYYHDLITHFPSVEDMAQASEESILQLWQGLGYYSRARNLHATAREIAHKYHGTFPASYHDLLALKGVGPYTAAAIASFAFNLPHPVIDGNVMRVLSRYIGISDPINSSKGKKLIHDALSALFDNNNPANFNQAIMELGALICKPTSPDCDYCPVRPECFAQNHGCVDILPVKSKKKPARNRYLHYWVIENQGNYLLHRRTANDIWKNLHEFLLIESPAPLTEFDILNANPIHPDNVLSKPDFVHHQIHQLTHQTLYVQFYHLHTMHFEPKNDFFWVKEYELKNYSMPILLRRFTDKYLI